MSTWKGIKVKHRDGREGVIVSDYTGFLHRALRIEVQEGKEAFVQLNSDGPDNGEAGWSWWCENFSEVRSGLPLATTRQHRAQARTPPTDQKERKHACAGQVRSAGPQRGSEGPLQGRVAGLTT